MEASFATRFRTVPGGKSAGMVLMILLGFWAGARESRGQFNPLVGGGPGKVKGELVSAVRSLQPGKPFMVALRMQHEEGWHTYWRNPGGPQLAPSIDWELPEGYRAGEIEWPTPHRGQLQGMMAYYYDGVNYLPVEITPPGNAAPGEDVVLKAKAQWQYCDEYSCMLGGADLELTLGVAGVEELNPEAAKTLEEFRKEHLPAPLKGWGVTAAVSGDAIELALTPEGDEANSDVSDVYFYSELTVAAADESQELLRKDGGFALRLARNPDFEGDLPPSLPGVLTAGNGWLQGGAPTAMRVNPPLTKGGTVTATPLPGTGEFLGILGLALLGGLILNLMPCVFPVIGIKVMGFVQQAGHERRKVTLHGLVFASGVVISFWILSAMLFILRLQGEKIGWGFQLQDPWFVYVLLLVLLIFALNMAGVFEVGASVMGLGSGLASRSGLAGTFFSGVLATVLATPCSAPFLATALGAVLTLPAALFFLVFTTIAVGLALPYLALSVFPGLVQKLPRPGPWMESFKQGMSFLLFATAAYLLWVYVGLLEDEDNKLAFPASTILGLVIVGAATWVYGRWCPPARSRGSRATGAAAALVLLVLGIWMGRPHQESLHWEEWSPGLVAELRAEGRPVYVDFTARWCVTCQTNKGAYRKRVQEEFQRKGVVLLKADYTGYDPAITEAIHAFERDAVPVNVLYVPGKEEPLLLPPLLSPGVVLDHLAQIPDTSNGAAVALQRP
ncbi:MAG TPA: protein-disulfide reductase DsbD domain-containing protein [Verrucomicrobiales bacterium]|nr:protein-disulfide reductase DsbD domain-containing protein [Verrucomicrobiales bacterium]